MRNSRSSFPIKLRFEVDSVLPVIVHWLLMGVSLYMSLVFFSSLATGSESIALGVIALGFELGRREFWRKVLVKRQAAMLALAIPLTILSIYAGASYLQDLTDESNIKQELRLKPVEIMQGQLEELTREIAQLSLLQSQLKPEYRSVFLDYSRRISTLQAQRNDLSEVLSIRGLEQPKQGNTARVSLGDRFGIPDFSFYFWLTVIFHLELGIIFTISGDENTRRPGIYRPRYSPRLSSPHDGIQTAHERPLAERVLVHAYVEKNYPLRGRRSLSEDLEVSERKVREVMEFLKDLKVIDQVHGVGMVLMVPLEEAVERVRGIR